MSETDPLVGMEFDGYRVLWRLARGGMADVYLAEEPALDRQVVLKVMLSQLALDGAFATRFRREGQTTARLNHPNIIQVYRIGTTPTARPYLAMQYVRGGSLQEKLAELAADDLLLTTPAALQLARQVADALAAAHQAGVVHRDLKPSNILLHPDGTPVVTDLGIAAVASASPLTRTGDIMGTPYYMSPEQAQGAGVDARSDLYALGVILYELLAGQKPFEGDSPLAVLHQQVNEPPPPLDTVRADLQPATLHVVSGCLQKDPNARWQSAAALRAALDAALTAEQQAAYATPVARTTALEQTQPRGRVMTEPPRPAAPAARRRVPRWPLALVGLLLLTALVLLIVPGLLPEMAETPATPPAETAAAGGVNTPPPTQAAPSLTPLPTPAATVTVAGTPVVAETAVVPTLPPPQPGEIAFQSNRDGDFEIYLMDETGGNQRQLTVNSADDQFPTASPDGTQILFQSVRDGNWEIYVMNADGSAQRRLTNTAASERLPSWSADGQQVLFLSDADGDYELYVMAADGSNPRQVTDTDLRAGHPSWSVDDRLVYNAGTLDGNTWEIYTADLSGGDVQQLTDNGVSDWSPEWSPDGARILFLRAVGRGDPAIYVMAADGSDAQLVYNSPDYEWGADWTPDGRILFTRESGSISYIYIMDGDGRNVVLLTDRGSYPTWVRR